MADANIFVQLNDVLEDRSGRLTLELLVDTDEVLDSELTNYVAVFVTRLPVCRSFQSDESCPGTSSPNIRRYHWNFEFITSLMTREEIIRVWIDDFGGRITSMLARSIQNDSEREKREAEAREQAILFFANDYPLYRKEHGDVVVARRMAAEAVLGSTFAHDLSRLDRATYERLRYHH